MTIRWAKGHRSFGRRMSVCVLVQLILFVFFVPCQVLAQPVIFVDDDATGANDGTSWCDAYVYLQDALVAAAASNGAITEIRVAQGLYKPDEGMTQSLGDRYATFALQNGLSLLGSYPGCGAIDPDSRDPALFNTILSGDLNGDDDRTPPGHSDCCGPKRWTPGCDDAMCETAVCAVNPNCCEDWWASGCAITAERVCCDLCRPTRCENSYTVVRTTGTDSTTLLDGFTITGGEANHTPEPEDDLVGSAAGGLYSRDASTTITNCTFVDNVGGSSSAMYTHTYSGTPTVSDCTFVDNGWYAVGGAPALTSNGNGATITDCRFIHNRGGGKCQGKQSDRWL